MRVLLSIVFLYILQTGYGQTPFVKMYSKFGTNTSENIYWPSQIIQTIDSGFAFTARHREPNPTYTHQDFALTKTDNLGNVEWYNMYGYADPNDDYLYHIMQGSDGNYILSGETYMLGKGLPGGFGGLDATIAKINQNGNHVWTSRFGNNENILFDNFFMTKEAPAGGYISVGLYKYSPFFFPATDAFMVRTDALGDTLWTLILQDNTVGETFAAVDIKGDGFIACGDVNGDILVTNVDSSGNIIWSNTYGMAGSSEIGTGIYTTPDKGALVAGYTNLAGYNEYCVMKLDSVGNVDWAKRYGGGAGESFVYWTHASAFTTDGGLLLNGSSTSFTTPNDGFLIKIDSIGTVEWSKTYGFCKADYIASCTQTYDGGYAFIMASSSTNSVILAKTDALGQTGVNCFETARTMSTNTIVPIINPWGIIKRGAVVNDTIPLSISRNLDVADMLCLPDSADFIWSPVAICPYDSIYFTGIYTTYSGFPSSFEWDFGDTASGSSNSSTIENPNHLFSNPGTYDVKFIVNWSCTTDTIILNIIIPVPDTSTRIVAICQGDSIFLEGAYQYTTDTYVDTFSNSIGCDSVVNTVLIIDTLPTATVNGDSILCNGALSILYASGGNSYLWNTGETTPTININPTDTTVYSVNVTNGLGCSDADSVLVIVTPTIATDIVSNDSCNKGFGSIDLTISGIPPFIFTWDNGMSTEDINNLTAGQYLVSITDSLGCTTIMNYIVGGGYLNCDFHVFVPNVFSPNGDGENDILQIKNSGMNEFYLKVYDRWGKLIFESNDINNSWKGETKGNPNNEGVYVYRLNATMLTGEEIEQVGNVILIR